MPFLHGCFSNLNYCIVFCDCDCEEYCNIFIKEIKYLVALKEPKVNSPKYNRVQPLSVSVFPREKSIV